MRFRNGIRLLSENFKGVYRLLLYRLVVGLVASALCCAMILPEFLEIVKSDAAKELISDIKDFFASFLSDEPTGLDMIIGKGGSLRALWQVVKSKAVTITWAIVGCIVVYLLKRFAETVAYFTTGSILNDKMATYAETPFFTSFVANLGKASVYALVYVPAVFVFDVITIAICYLILSTVNVFLGLFLSMTVIVVCQALKLTFTSLWVPAMTADNRRLRDVFKASSWSDYKQKGKMFSTYVVCVYAIIIVNVIGALSTFFSALILTVPASYLFLLCVHYVNYYTLKGKSYFITYEKIATNPDRGDREHFFDYIETAEKEDTTIEASVEQKETTNE
ncbi:MAG: hypothetical protein IJV85_04625 [Clostridia bacterium]|nr:hypothetical protein [Clostridia bacterium]